jgi:hypothetical protein
MGGEMTKLHERQCHADVPSTPAIGSNMKQQESAQVRSKDHEVFEASKAQSLWQHLEITWVRQEAQ